MVITRLPPGLLLITRPDDTPYWDAQCVRDHVAVAPDEDDDSDWIEDHMKAYCTAGMQRPDTNELLAFSGKMPIPAQARWFRSRPVREQELAFFWSEL